MIASVIGIAGAGVKLSIKLYTFSETVSTAPDSIKSIAKDISLISSALEQLGDNLKHDEQARLYSKKTLALAQTTIKECEAVFEEIEGTLKKSMERLSTSPAADGRGRKPGKVVLSAMERMKWPFLQPKMELLRSDLEKLKTTLMLMMEVLSHARKVQKQYVPINLEFFSHSCLGVPGRI